MAMSPRGCCGSVPCDVYLLGEKRATVSDKTQIITMLREELSHWEELLAGISKAQATAPHLRSKVYQGYGRPLVRLAAAFHRTAGGCPAQRGPRVFRVACRTGPGFGRRRGSDQCLDLSSLLGTGMVECASRLERRVPPVLGAGGGDSRTRPAGLWKVCVVGRTSALFGPPWLL